MGELPAHQFPVRARSGVLFGLSAARLAAVGAAGVVFIVTTSLASVSALAAGSVIIVGLGAAAAVPVAGRVAIDWVPVWLLHGWSMATRNNEFYASADLAVDLPDGALDLPGELFGLELHTFDPATTDGRPHGSYGVVRDTFRDRLVVVAEVSGAGFLVLDPDEQQARIAGWGATLDHVAQTLPDLCRLQVVHLVGPATAPTMARPRTPAGRDDRAAGSYRDVVAAAAAAGQDHQLLVAIALDLQAARRAVRQAGGGIEGGARVLMDRAAVVEQSLAGCGLDVHGWLPAAEVAGVLRRAFDPAAATAPADGVGVRRGGDGDPAACGPRGMVDQWSVLRHDSGWSCTLQVVRPPARPVTGDFLQHLLVGVPATRRLSMLLTPTPMAVAERRAQTQQVTTESEQALRARWGFGTSARHRREHGDASRREQDLVEGRAVYRVVWMVTVTAPTPTELAVAVGEAESAARRCSLELRRLTGTQRQAACFTLPLCRGAR